MATARRNWTEDEVTLALGLYIATPYSRITQANPEIQKLAAALGRSPGAVSLKLANLAALDPRVAARGRKGFANGSQADRAVWRRFVQDNAGTIEFGALQDTVFDLAQQYGVVQRFAGTLAPDLGDGPATLVIDGTERTVTRRERRGQDFFRLAVLANFEERCAVSHCSCPTLLEAAHILPWADSAENRLNPANGLALNRLLHAAYDNDLLGIDADGRVSVAKRLLREAGDNGLDRMLAAADGYRIDFSRLRVPPNRDFLSARHARYLKAA